MSKKIVYIVLGALLIFGLLFLLWSWFFSGSKSGSLTGGLFGTASDTVQTIGDTSPGGNYTTTLGQRGDGINSANGSIPLNGTGGSGSVGGNTAGTGGTGVTSGAGTGATLSSSGSITVPGVTWLNSAKGSGINGGGSGTAFTPADINSLANGAGGFNPTISSNPAGSNGGTSLINALAVTAIAGSLTCALQAGVLGASTASVGTSASGAAVVATGLVSPPIPGSSPGIQPNVVADYGVRQILGATYTSQAANTAKNATKDSVPFQQCLINVIGKVALQQITISVVNWINSGFNGQPSFVNNFEQFFTNVADLAAGQFIQGSALAFLCSPFKLQIKVAIAQSYANRGAQSCSLTGIIKNINNFMNGSFTQAGWPGLLQFTTVPTNNPYGAFAYAQVGLITAQNNATVNAKNNISPTGFLNLTQVYGCTDPSQNGLGGSASIGTNAQAAAAAGKSALGANCKTKVVTPGAVIADSLGAVNKSGIDQLGVGNSIDQIISALTTQLMTKILQNGLSSLSQPQGTTQTAGDLAAQQQAARLLIDMQNKVTIAQQIGTIDQGSISDIESAQNNLNTLANCWGAVASSSSSSAALGAQNAATANTTLHSLNAQIDGYNNNITQLNAEIATINNFESRVSTAATIANVSAVSSSYSAAVAAGAFASQADITTAQQNRVTLQSQMSALNQSTATGLQQCSATTH